MKKGFTLIELLAIIALIGIVALVVFPVVLKSIQNSKQNLYDIQVREIEQAGEKWATEHIQYMDRTHLNSTGVSLYSLISAGYLQRSKVMDPRHQTEMNGCILISYDSKINQYQYHYTEEVCSQAITNGYVYELQGDGWTQLEVNPIASAADAIIDYYASNNLIKAEGQMTAGFYDEGERYVFRGGTVNNYVKLNGGTEIYRILSIDKSTGSIRLMGTTAIPNSWDSEGGLVFENASIVTVQLDNYYNNSSNGILLHASKVETNVKWNVGAITGDASYDVLKSLENDRIAYTKIGLPSISDYVGASPDLSCHSSIISDACKQENYLYELWKDKNTWTINTDNTQVWYVNENGILNHADPSTIYYIYPVIALKNNVYIETGDGKPTSPYIFQ